MNERLKLIHLMPNRRFWMYIVLSALILRIAAVLIFGSLNQPQLYEYGGIARHLVAGKGYSTVFPILHSDYGRVSRVYDDATPTAFTLPGVTLIVAAVFFLFREGATAFIILYALNILASLASVLLISRCATLMFNKDVGRWTAVLAAAFPTIVVSVATFGGTPWYHLTMSLALWLLLRASTLSATIPTVLLAGIAAGMWTMFRAEGFPASLVLALWLGSKRSWSRAALFTAMLILSCVPWAARNTVIFGKVVPFTTNVWLNAWRGNHEGSSGGSFKAEGGANWLRADIRREVEAIPHNNAYELAVMDIYRRSTLQFLREHPMEAAGLYVKKMLMFFSIDFSDRRARSPLYWLPHALLTIGALAGGIVLHRRRLDALPIVGIIAVSAVIVSALHVESRYQMILALLYIVLMAAAINATVGRRSVKISPLPPVNEGSAA